MKTSTLVNNDYVREFAFWVGLIAALMLLGSVVLKSNVAFGASNQLRPFVATTGSVRVNGNADAHCAGATDRAVQELPMIELLPRGQFASPLRVALPAPPDSADRFTAAGACDPRNGARRLFVNHEANRVAPVRAVYRSLVATDVTLGHATSRIA